jgi:hypothetical protein
MDKAWYEVIVQNIGKVHEGYVKYKAIHVYKEYVVYSKVNLGRAAGEGVTLWKNGEIIKEYAPKETME